MSIWIVHLPEDRLPAEHEAEEGSEGTVHLPFDDLPDATSAPSQAALRQRLKALSPDATPESIARKAERLWAYAHSVQAEDIIAFPVQSRAEVWLAQALGRVAYAGNCYVLPVSWFGRRVKMARFGKRRAMFEPKGNPLREVGSEQNRTAIRAHLPLPGSRFARVKWIMGLMMFLGILRMALQFMHRH